jgi:ankyrin repeat protein
MNPIIKIKQAVLLNDHNIVEKILNETNDNIIYYENVIKYACRNGYIEIINSFLNNYKNITYDFMIDEAAENGHFCIVDLLLISENYKIKYSKNSFYLACQNGHEKIVDLLMRQKEFSLSKNNYSEIISVSKNGYISILKKILNHSEYQRDILLEDNIIKHSIETSITVNKIRNKHNNLIFI